MRVVKHIALAVFLLSSLLSFAQIPSELACAAGSSDMESPTYNGTTQKTRSWLCVDATGHVSSPVFGAVGSGVTSFNTRTGAVVPVNTDYGTVGILGGVAVLPIQTVSGGAIQLGDNNVSGGDQLLLSSAGGAVLNDAAGDSLTIHGGTATFNTPITVTSCTGCTPATTSFTALSSGTNTTAAMIVGTGASLTTSGSGTITATTAPFSGLSGSTNSTAAMIVGTGASLTFSGTGSINASLVNGATLPAPSAAGHLLNSTAANVWAETANVNLGAVGGGTGQITFSGNSSGSFNLKCNSAACTGLSTSGPFTVNGLTISNSYATAANCSSSASPAVCTSAPAGSVVIAAGASTVTVNTTAGTANSQILLTSDDSLSTKLGVTCNSTVATIVGGLAVTARTGGTSFQITSGVTPAVNPLCISYIILN